MRFVKEKSRYWGRRREEGKRGQTGEVGSKSPARFLQRSHLGEYGTEVEETEVRKITSKSFMVQFGKFSTKWIVHPILVILCL